MKEQKTKRAIEGKVIYLLILVTITQVIYPISANGNVLALIGYQLLVATWVVIGIFLAQDTKRLQQFLIGLGIVWAITGAIYAFNQTSTWALLVAYVVLITFHSVVVWIMLRFIFQAQSVTRDVLYAASAVYLMLGAIFVSVFGLVETVTFVQTGLHAFSDPTVGADQIFPWQNFVYYSYATLTTLGYGDVLPVTPWARSFASLEAIIGVLYITIIMARLVGLYAAGEVEQDLLEQNAQD